MSEQIPDNFKQLLKIVKSNTYADIKIKYSIIPVLLAFSNAVTFGKTIYLNPYKRNHQNIYTILHELMHSLDQTKKSLKLIDINPNTYRVRFNYSFKRSLNWYIKYTFPQNLILLTLFGFWSKWFLLFLIFLIPIQSLTQFRLRSELRGYFWNFYYKSTIINYTDLNRILTSYLPYFKPISKARSNKFYEILYSEMVYNRDTDWVLDVLIRSEEEYHKSII